MLDTGTQVQSIKVLTKQKLSFSNPVNWATISFAWEMKITSATSVYSEFPDSTRDFLKSSSYATSVCSSISWRIKVCFSTTSNSGKSSSMTILSRSMSILKARLASYSSYSVIALWSYVTLWFTTNPHLSKQFCIVFFF